MASCKQETMEQTFHFSVVGILHKLSVLSSFLPFRSENLRFYFKEADDVDVVIFLAPLYLASYKGQGCSSPVVKKFS